MTQEYILKPAHGARDLHIDYRGELNDQQFEAVTTTGADGSVNSSLSYFHVSGPALVTAFSTLTLFCYRSVGFCHSTPGILWRLICKLFIIIYLYK